jgi:hypothetical protein
MESALWSTQLFGQAVNVCKGQLTELLVSQFNALCVTCRRS